MVKVSALVKIDSLLWKSLRIKCLTEDVFVSSVVEKLVSDYLKKGGV